MKNKIHTNSNELTYHFFCVYVIKVDEVPSFMKDYAYFVAGKALCGYKKDSLGINYE